MPIRSSSSMDTGSEGEQYYIGRSRPPTAAYERSDGLDGGRGWDGTLEKRPQPMVRTCPAACAAICGVAYGLGCRARCLPVIDPFADDRARAALQPLVSHGHPNDHARLKERSCYTGQRMTRLSQNRVYVCESLVVANYALGVGCASVRRHALAGMQRDGKPCAAGGREGSIGCSIHRRRAYGTGSA
jgi:hypothetical protein